MSLIGLASCSSDAPQQEDNAVEISSLVSETSSILVPSTVKLLDEKSLRYSEDNETAVAEKFAILVAKSLSESDFREFLKDEANKMYDGDYDILVSNVITKKLGSEDFRTKISKQSISKSVSSNEIFLLATQNERLNISVPLHIEKWNTSKQLPLVAVSIGSNETTTTYLKAFDATGRTYLIDAKIEPDVPVIVIGDNERMNYKKNDTTEKKLRTSGNPERITFIKCPDLNSIEAWHRGGPEIQFDCVVYNNDFSAAFQAASGIRSHVSRNTAENGWIPISSNGQELFQWCFEENHEPDYFLQVGEMDDAGGTQNLQ